MSNNATVKRIKKELADIEKAKSPHFIVKVGSNDLFNWDVTLMGPPDTPYEGGRFKLYVKLPEDYPFKPPAISFITRVYHTNISERGGICLDLLSSNWSACLTMSKLFLSMSSFLENPSSDHGLRFDVYNLYRSNREAYNKKVREETRLYAMDHLTEAEKDAIQNKNTPAPAQTEDTNNNDGQQ